MLSLRSPWSQLHVKFNLLTFAKSPVSLFLNRAVMNENICASWLGDESVTFGIVKPLNRARNFPHIHYPWKNLNNPLASIKANCPHNPQFNAIQATVKT